MTDDREDPSGAAPLDGGITRRRFAALSGATLLGTLLGTPARLDALAPRPAARRPFASTGTFDVRITMVGLCFFVPDPRTARMHVLMPGTGGHAHADGVGRHVVRLLYDAAHERAGAEELAGEVVSVPLEDVALDFANVPGGLDLALPEPVVDVSPVVRDGVNRDTLGEDADGRLRARVSFAAGQLAVRERGLRWDLGPYRARQMTNAAVWTIPAVPGDGLELLAAGLHGTAARTLPPLHPVGGTLDLVLVHLPPAEMLPYGRPRELPRPGFASADFAAYYRLFDNPAETPLPRLSAEEDVRAVPAAYRPAAAAERAAFGDIVINCLVGGGRPKPGGGPAA